MASSVLTWNRLEPSVRSEANTEQGFRFAVHDALWLLTRQWQFGELDGDDAASAAFVSYHLQSSPVQFYGLPDGKPYPMNLQETPPEQAVEQQLIGPALHIRIEMGRKWIQLLSSQLNEAEKEPIIKAFRQNKKLWFYESEDFDRQSQFDNASYLFDEAHMQALAAVAHGRMIDGWVIYKELLKGEKASKFLSAPHAAADETGKLFINWYSNTYGQNTLTPSAWQPKKLEYQPQFAYAVKDGTVQTLSSEEYRGDGLNWMGFGVNLSKKWEGANGPVPDTEKNSEHSETVIPSNVRFAGMPSPRLWEMEDNTVDFGSIQAGPTDISKMIFAQFGLVYSNDWLTAPLDLPFGNICEISSMVVTDIFGRQTELRGIRPDDTCAYFTTPGLKEGAVFALADMESFQQKSQAFEKISMVADEMANLVWGIELRTEHALGYSENGYHNAKMLDQYFFALAADTGSGQPTPTNNTETLYQYKLASSVPSNWIPFMPVQPAEGASLPGQRRKIELQRAALPRIVEGFPVQRIRPRTALLGAADRALSDKREALFIFRDEIPRSGADLQFIWKRMRWFDGSVKVWPAKMKTFGRGEVNAGFEFDTLKRK